jgi:hypothetical protein
MSLFQKRVSSKISQNNVVTIVSGLPRSGTSMMMQMLAAGGMDTLTDGIRKSDVDNPKGYYEFEIVKTIQDDKSWIDGCAGKVIKMVSMLLYYLPDDRRYKVVFMRRNMKEMIASQFKMLDRLERDDEERNEVKLAIKYDRHLREIQPWLKVQKHIDVLYISYNHIINNPEKYIKKLNRFLGNHLNEKKMVQTIDKSLYRQKT